MVAAIISNLAMVMVRITRTPEWVNDPDMHLILMTGIGEALTPGIVGFTALALAWMFVAMSIRRNGDLL